MKKETQERKLFEVLEANECIRDMCFVAKKISCPNPYALHNINLFHKSENLEFSKYYFACLLAC